MNHPLLPYLLAQIRQEYNVDLSGDPLALGQLGETAAKVWPRLQNHEVVTVHIPALIRQREQLTDLHLVIQPEDIQFLTVSAAGVETVLGYSWSRLGGFAVSGALGYLVLGGVVSSQITENIQDFTRLMCFGAFILLMACLFYLFSVRRIWVYPEHVVVRSLLTGRQTHIMAAEISDFYSIYSKNALTYYLLLHGGKKVAVSAMHRTFRLHSFPPADLERFEGWLRRHHIPIEYEINRINPLRFRP